MTALLRPRPAISVALLAALGMILSSPAFAACLQDHAVYTDRDDDYTLTFKSVPDDGAAVTSDEFTIKMNDSDLKMDGVVMWDKDGGRPNATIRYKCPAGDATGAELQQCTVWKGVVYALKEGADAELLPKAKEPSAQALLLPDFSGAMSSFNFKLEKPLEAFTWEVFRFKDCVPEH